MSYSQQDVLSHMKETGLFPDSLNGVTVRSTTRESMERKGLIKSNTDGLPVLSDLGKKRASSLKENIGQHRTRPWNFYWKPTWRKTFDPGTPNYKFWDDARRGKAKGLEIGGLFLKPLSSKKSAWVLPSPPSFEYDDAYTKTVINDWFREHHAEILLAYEESAALGDFYIIVNPDESLTLIPPHVVEPLVAEDDFTELVGWRITQVFGHPSDMSRQMIVTDEFTIKERRRTIEGKKETEAQRFRNPLPYIPVVHIANNLSANEMFGHPEGEALLKALQEYDEIITAANEGVIMQGRPIPVFSKMGDAEAVDKFADMYGEDKTRELDDGTTEEWKDIQIPGGTVVVLGGTGELQQVQPRQFTQDPERMLGLLFYLVVQHTEMPEFIFGNAISSSKASAESQLAPFVKWAEKEQGRAGLWLMQLALIIQAMKALADAKVKQGEKPIIKHAPLTDADGKLTIEAIKVALSLGGWDPKDLVPFYPLDIDNPEEIIAHIQAMEDEVKSQMAGHNEPFVPMPDDTDDESEDDSTNDDPEPEEETEIAKMARKAMREQGHTGVMVAFEIDLDTATDLASAARQSGLDDVTAPEDMHLTLAFLGDRSDIEDSQDVLIENLEQFAALDKPVSGAIAGVGRFNASENSDGKDVIYASFDAPDLPEFRQSLVAVIEDAGISVFKNHGFTPHITLAMINKDKAMPNLALETMELKFTHITLYWGDERTHFELYQPDPMTINEPVINKKGTPVWQEKQAIN